MQPIADLCRTSPLFERVSELFPRNLGKPYQELVTHTPRLVDEVGPGFGPIFGLLAHKEVVFGIGGFESPQPTFPE